MNTTCCFNAIFIKSLLLLACGGIAIGQNIVSGNIESVPSRTPQKSTVSFKNKSTLDVYTVNSDSSTGHFSIKIPSGTYIQEVHGKNKFLYKDTNFVVSTNKTSDVQLMENLPITSPYYSDILQVFKDLTGTWDGSILNTTFRFVSDNPLRLFKRNYDSLDANSMNKLPFDFKPYVDSVFADVEQKSNGIINFREESTDSVSGISMIYPPSGTPPMGGSDGFTSRSQSGLDIKRSTLYINRDNNDDDPEILKRTVNREVGRGVGLENFGKDPTYVMKIGTNLSYFFHHDEGLVMQLNYTLKPHTDMTRYRDSIIASVNFVPEIKNALRDTSVQQYATSNLANLENVFFDDGVLLFTQNSPSHLNATIVNNILSITPEKYGIYKIVVTAKDDLNRSVIDTIDVNIQKVNTPPNSSSTISPKGVVSNNVNFVWSKSSDKDNDPVSYTMHVQGNKDTSATTTDTSKVLNLKRGNYSWFVTSTDGEASVNSDTSNFVVPNRNPTFATKPTNKKINQRSKNVYVGKLVVSDLDNDELNIILTPTSGISAKLSNDSLYVSTIEDSSGLHKLIISANDNHGGVIQDSITIDVNYVNRSPFVSSAMGSKNVLKNSGETFIAKPSNVISDPDLDVLTDSVKSTNSNIAGYVRNDSLFVKSANNFFGSGKIILKRYDPSNFSASDTLSVTVQNVNRAPVFTSTIDSAKINQRSKDNYFGKISATDLDGDALRDSIATTSGISARMSNDSMFVSTEGDFHGNAKIVAYKIDSFNSSISDTIDVIVNYVNRKPTSFDIAKVNPDTVKYGNINIAINWSKALDADNDALTYHTRLKGGKLDTTFNTTDTSIMLQSSILEPKITYEITGFVDDNIDTTNASNSSGFVTADKLLSVRREVPLPSAFDLSQNYPNPFNPSTTIRYGIPSSSHVSLKIYNVIGQQIADLVNNEQSAGWYETIWTANVSSGLYFYRIEAINSAEPNKRFTQSKKMILLK